MSISRVPERENELNEDLKYHIPAPWRGRQRNRAELSLFPALCAHEQDVCIAGSTRFCVPCYNSGKKEILIAIIPPLVHCNIQSNIHGPCPPHILN